MSVTEELGAESRRQRHHSRQRNRGEFEFGQFVKEFGGEAAWQNSDYEDVEVDPRHPTHARPGSEEKVRMMAARYASGLPLWHHEDCSDHGSAGKEVMGLRVVDLLTLEATQGRDGRFSEKDSAIELFGKQ